MKQRMKSIRMIKWIFVLAAIGFLGPPGILKAEESNGDGWVSKIISLQGNVRVRRQGETSWQPVQLNDTFFAGDQIRVETNSRAGIVLSNDAVMRLDQDTTLILTAIEQKRTFIFRLLEGAANFFSHRPRSLKILTPFVNGVVEGTEFYVQVDAMQAHIDLFEGRILAENEHGALKLKKGEGALAQAGSSPQRYLLVRPRESVQWAMYYPPILALGPGQPSIEINDAMVMVEVGLITDALQRLESIASGNRDAAFFVCRAAIRLHVGRIALAQADLQKALGLNPQNGDALALSAVIAVVQNRVAEAVDLARQAVRCTPGSASVHIALSYALQARFDLPGALDAAREAVVQAPGSGLAWARLADLQLSVGDLDRGVDAARKAVSLASRTAHAHTVLGFAHLTRIETKVAREAFERAIMLDSAAPLPRLGLGLADVRDGDLEKGRSEIEIAAGLDPGNSLIRSYLGKAYFDEKRDPQDGQQFEIAKALDPNDPTPWFYDAIRKQTLNRPVEALRDLEKSIELNDNRAVYRSRLMLDEDLAARSASLGRIYSDLGFEQLALSEGWKAVNTNYADYSGHRFLSDNYSKLKRHEIAKASELLQAKLLQPINLTPLQPQQNDASLLILEGAGPSKPSFNEFNPLFVGNDLAFQASGIAGNRDTLGDELTLSGVHDNISYAVGQMHYQTDGFRDNNDLTYDIYNVFTQYSFAGRHSIQAEYRYRETERGDLSMHFDPDYFDPNKRIEEERHSIRVGGNFQLGPRDNIIASLNHVKLDSHYTDYSETIGQEFQWSNEQDINTTADATSGELQYIRQWDRLDLVSGAGTFYQDETEDTFIRSIEVIPSLPPESDITDTTEDHVTHHSNGYLYTNFNGIRNMTWTFGVSYIAYDSYIIENNRFNFKGGLIWSPHRTMTFRGAWFQDVGRPFTAQETLEPTQVAGFNQFFDDVYGSETVRYGAAVDLKLPAGCFAGLELSWRDVDLPSYDRTTETTTIENQEETFHRAYLGWLPVASLALMAEAFQEEFDNVVSQPAHLTTYRFPLSAAWFLPGGFYAKAVLTLVKQDFENSWSSDKDRFWVTDLSVGFRLPKRLGTISLGAKNLFNEKFNYQDYNFNTDEPLTPMYIPDQTIFARVALAF